MRLTSTFIGPLLGMCAFSFLGLVTSAQAGEGLQGKELISALQKGGHVIYLRHSTTDHTSSDQDPLNYTDPNTQRNLSEEGQKRAMALGNAVRALNIPIGKVITSPFCRAVETGWFAFGRGETNDDLAFAIGTTETEAKRLGVMLKKMMQVAPEAGTNTILISHTANLKEAVGVWPKEEGVFVVFKPSSSGDPTYVGEIPINTWPKLAEQFADKKVAAAEQEIPTVERSVLCGELAGRPTTKHQAKR
ncbi:MAG: hypothetical protein AB7G75_15700 [Candidatus Binatia bacterium]